MMDETKATARLPAMNIEITHRQSEGGEAEYVAVKITAEPSFKAFGAFIEQQGPMPLGPMAMNPFAPWLQMMQMAWQPWLKLLGCGSLIERQPEADKPASSTKD